MSLLMFIQDPDRVVVVTDTLATTENGTPHMFVSKCWPIPHMRTIVAATGSGLLLDQWVEFVRTSMLARDVVNLDLHTPNALRELWEEVAAQHESRGVTATIYQFGIDPDTGKSVRFTYRSTNNFASERSDEAGFGCRPPLADLDALATMSNLVEIATAVRDEQGSMPNDERVYIGGDLIATTIDARGIHIEHLHRFADWANNWNTMCERAADPIDA